MLSVAVFALHRLTSISDQRSRARHALLADLFTRNRSSNGGGFWSLFPRFEAERVEKFVAYVLELVADFPEGTNERIAIVIVIIVVVAASGLTIATTDDAYDGINPFFDIPLVTCLEVE